MKCENCESDREARRIAKRLRAIDLNQTMQLAMIGVVALCLGVLAALTIQTSSRVQDMHRAVVLDQR